jgi:hypothetical protein
VPDDKTAIGDVKDLLARVGGQVVELGVKLPALLSQLHFVAGQEQRRREVVPQRIAGEVEGVEPVPPEPPAHAGEQPPRVAAFGQRLTGVGLDPHDVALEHAPPAGFGVRLHQRAGLRRGDGHPVAAERPGRELGGEREAARTEVGLDRDHRVPALESSVGLEYLLEQAHTAYK